MAYLVLVSSEMLVKPFQGPENKIFPQIVHLSGRIKSPMGLQDDSEMLQFPQ